MGVKRIPISILKDVSKKYGQTHVVMMTFDRSSGLTHIVTYGKSVKDCEQAAEGGNFIKKVLGWPDKLCHVTPARSRKSQENKEIKLSASDNNARTNSPPDCCDESKCDLRDWIECGFKFCPWCGRELRPVA